MDRTRLLAQLKALGEEGRLEVALSLAGGEHGVPELLRALGVSQPNLSRQIKILREAGVVVERRDGRQAFYRLGDNELTATVLRLAVRSAPAEASEARTPGPQAPSVPGSSRRNIHESAYEVPGGTGEPAVDEEQTPRRSDFEEWLL
jgi:DNA-binding transcriptional ArsR family regulator